MLVRWRDSERPAGGAALDGAPILSVTSEALTPTIRPADDARPAPGGIYVHRWFEVEAGAADEIRGAVGPGLGSASEATFDTPDLPGLFRAAPSDADRAAGSAAAIADHLATPTTGSGKTLAIPTTEAMQIFARRQQLTRRSWAWPAPGWFPRP